jgi:hypothetical protein
MAPAPVDDARAHLAAGGTRSTSGSAPPPPCSSASLSGIDAEASEPESNRESMLTGAGESGRWTVALLECDVPGFALGAWHQPAPVMANPGAPDVSRAQHAEVRVPLALRRPPAGPPPCVRTVARQWLCPRTLKVWRGTRRVPPTSGPAAVPEADRPTPLARANGSARPTSRAQSRIET